MNILLLGSGGREHALAWKMRQSAKCNKLYVAPGNAGTAGLAENVDLDVLDFSAIRNFIVENQIDTLVVGPEEPLVKGIKDALQDVEGLLIIGPDMEGAQLEGSKAYAKEFMKAAGIPTADYASFVKGQEAEAVAFLDQMQVPYVIKADGLAAGKGVIITSDKAEAAQVIRDMMGGSFGAAGATLVLESFLKGIEYSVFVMSDGENWKLLPVAKDYKRVGEGDTGPNTGGMGAVTPVPFFNDALREKTIIRIVEPTMAELKKRKIVYQGFIFIGLINVEGEPFVIEYNCRMGDPETEVVMPALKSDLLELFDSIRKGNFAEQEVQIHNDCFCTIMLCSGGYPGSYEKGKEVLLPTDDEGDTLIFHAGTKETTAGKVLTNGGRVMAITSRAEDITTALMHSMSVAEKVEFEGKFFRKDIGFDL